VVTVRIKALTWTWCRAAWCACPTSTSKSGTKYARVAVHTGHGDAASHQGRRPHDTRCGLSPGRCGVVELQHKPSPTACRGHGHRRANFPPQSLPLLTPFSLFTPIGSETIYNIPWTFLIRSGSRHFARYSCESEYFEMWNVKCLLYDIYDMSYLTCCWYMPWWCWW